MAKKSTIKLIGDVEKWCFGAAVGIIFMVKLMDGEPASGRSRTFRPTQSGVSLGSLEPLPDPTRPIFPSAQKRAEALSETLSENGFALPSGFEKKLGLTAEQKIYLQKTSNRLAQKLGSGSEKAPNLETIVRDWMLAFEQTERIFLDFQPKNSQKSEGQDLVAAVLADPKKAEKVFEKIELNFSIPREDARAFAKGHDWATLADWADFVEKRLR